MLVETGMVIVLALAFVLLVVLFMALIGVLLYFGFRKSRGQDAGILQIAASRLGLSAGESEMNGTIRGIPVRARVGRLHGDIFAVTVPFHPPLGIGLLLIDREHEWEFGMVGQQADFPDPGTPLIHVGDPAVDQKYEIHARDPRAVVPLLTPQLRAALSMNHREPCVVRVCDQGVELRQHFGHRWEYPPRAVDADPVDLANKVDFAVRVVEEILRARASLYR